MESFHDWDVQERIWKHMFRRYLPRTNYHDHPVLITDHAFNPISQKERMTEFFFETFSIPCFFVADPALLSVYANGRGTALVCEMGDGVISTLQYMKDMDFCKQGGELILEEETSLFICKD